MKTKFDVGDNVKGIKGYCHLKGKIRSFSVNQFEEVIYKVRDEESNIVICVPQEYLIDFNPCSEQLRELADRIDKGEINVDNFGFNKRGGNKIWSGNEVKGQTVTQHIFRMNYKYNKEGE